MNEANEPSTSKTAFCCPHCGAYTTQYWLDVHGEYVDQKDRLPTIHDMPEIDKINMSREIKEEAKKAYIKLVQKRASGEIFIERHESSKYVRVEIANLFMSECFNCHKLAIWVYKQLIYPIKRIGVEPNPDLPDEIKRDFNEAREILRLSPRGACAILRLSIQKMCVVLGERGKSIDEDIASLVSKGLNPQIQKALDVVRVIGNEAVHPGILDLKDDADTAEELLGLINIIAEQLITIPKNIKELYGKLPEKKRKAIEERDGKK